jgi:hypothetical protein
VSERDSKVGGTGNVHVVTSMQTMVERRIVAEKAIFEVLVDV